ncbi:MAG: hypothetical protein CMJ35_04120 [Phycisphaerae bacterium]|nr:hypothetical protein [Phycisphaerae bacterium]HCT45509.1 hypothetical protein [Phycisphaerales bacterium]
MKIENATIDNALTKLINSKQPPKNIRGACFQACFSVMVATACRLLARSHHGFFFPSVLPRIDMQQV